MVFSNVLIKKEEKENKAKIGALTNIGKMTFGISNATHRPQGPPIASVSLPSVGRYVCM